MVTSSDVLNFLLILGFLIITICIVLATFFLVKALKSIARLTDNLENTSENFKNSLQIKALSSIPAIILALISRLLRRR